MSFKVPSDNELLTVETIRQKILSDDNDINNEILNKFTNTTILRFLRGQKGNVDLAYDSVTKYMKWRMNEHIDDIFSTTVESKFQREINSGKFIYGNTNLNGQPVGFGIAHRHNANDRDIEQMKLFVIWTLEKLFSLSKPDEERFSIVFDLGRFSLSCMDYEVVKYLISILQANYPETLDSLLIIDSPFIFSACWMLIKPWLDPVTAAKVQFISRDKLTNYIAIEYIPDTIKNKEL